MTVPTAYTGAINSYTDTTAQVRCIEELIQNISPEAIPFTKLIGVNSIKNPAVFSTTYEWLEDQLAPTATTLAAAITATTTTCLVATNAGKFFRAGHLIDIDGEIMRVSGVSTDTLTILQGIGDTTPANHDNGATVNIVGFALVEGADAPDSFKMDVSTQYNYTQIFQETVEVTGTQAKMKQYGIASEMPYQISKKLKELAILLERNVFFGYRSAGSATVARMFGGLKQFVTDNVANASSAALTEKDVMDRMQACFEDVGLDNMPKTLICGGWIKRKITSFYAPYARMTRAEKTGGVIIDQIDTEFGTLDVMLNNWASPTDLWFLNTNMIEIGPLRPFEQTVLSKSGDKDKTQILGEYTVKVKNDKCHGRIYGLSTSS
jgi:hypothetical protein